MNRCLHIISLTVPYPVSYGGVVDIYYKITALHRAGVEIILHCFSADDRKAPELEGYCKEVYYYRRETGWRGTSLLLPYIVSSRANQELAERLNKDAHPILMEGIHCSHLLLDRRFADRHTTLRLHNVEHRYYYSLFSHSHSAFRKLYYLLESVLLKNYEKKIAKLPTLLITVSQQDSHYYERGLKRQEAKFLPVFTGFTAATIKPGTGTYCLYHGNLSVDENLEAVRWLMDKVFASVATTLIIAGKNPPPALVQEIASRKNITLVANPSTQQMEELIEEAQIHVLPSFNNTGVKLKVIHALFRGRHCMVNSAAVAGSGLAECCTIAETAAAFGEAIERLMDQPLQEADVSKRNMVLKKLFDDDANCAKLIQWIW